MLLAVCRKLDIDTPEEIIPRIAYGFAGGMGNTGATCGAVCGGVMAIGLARDRPDSMEGMLGELELAARLRRRFEAEMGSTSCRELTGVDLTTDEGMQAFMTSDTPERVCMRAVDLAEQLVVDLIV